VATVTNINIRKAVSDHGGAAVSARLLLAARPWTVDAGVCPAPAQPRGGLGLALARIEVTGRQVHLLESAYASTPAHQISRQFDKHDPGIPGLRPPV
jgi:hypothetical protein